MKDTLEPIESFDFKTYEIFLISIYPALPRLVAYDPKLYEQFNPLSQDYPWFRNANHLFCNVQATFSTNETPVRPYALGDKRHFLGGYIAYVKEQGEFGTDTTRQRLPAEILMLQIALRRHPQLQSILDEKRKELVGNNYNNSSSNGTEGDYMTLKAKTSDLSRKKVVNLIHFLPINRPLLEKAKGKRKAMGRHLRRSVVHLEQCSTFSCVSMPKSLWGRKYAVILMMYWLQDSFVVRRTTTSICHMGS